MPGIRPEDAKVKIPALIHLSRLGYQYTPLAGIVRDRDTNILPEDLRQAIAQINGSETNDAAFEKLLSEIGKSLGQEDLGRDFSNGLQQGWNGTRVIDFAHPDRNLYRVMTEVPYVSGKHRFRPDITLFINGLPLAFVELKSSESRDGILPEYDRMTNRIGKPEFRRFINLTQLMVFSNDAEYDESALFPIKGAFYATSAYNDLVFHRFEEAEREMLERIEAPAPEAVSLILRDNQAEALAVEPAFAASLAPDSPTHRMLTSLFHRQRLLFFLRYGISYVEAEGAHDAKRFTRQIIRYPQLFAIRFLEHQLRSGQNGGIWKIPPGHRAQGICAMIRFMEIFFEEQGCIAQYDYIAFSPAQMQLTLKALLQQGIPVRCRSGLTAPRSGILREKNHSSSPTPSVCVHCAEDYSSLSTQRLSANGLPARRILFLDGTENRYDMDEAFTARLRREAPEAFIIVFSDP